MLRQASLSTEDKKRVLTMVGSPLEPGKVERAMGQLSIKVLVGQSDGKKRVYPVNFVEDEPEEMNAAMEAEPMDTWLSRVTKRHKMIRDFEDQLIEVCQENQDLATCYSAYAEARAKIRDRLRTSRLLAVDWAERSWKREAEKEVVIMGGKGFRRKDSLAERIAASNCRRCGQRGHWKWEGPAKDASGNKEEVNVAEDVMFSSNDMEIVDTLPDGVQGSETIADLFLNMHSQDRESITCSPLGNCFQF